MRLDDPGTIWYVITRRDNGYPLIVYPEKERAELIAKANNENVVAVRVVGQSEGSKP